MNIQEEKISDLSAVVRIQVAPDDYQAKVEDSLRDLGRKVQLKGFRPGKVPRSMVRKLYGNQVLAEQLDRIVREELSGFLQNREVRLLGQPLPQESEALVIDIESPSNYEFAYEIGLSPEFNLTALGKQTVLTRQRIEADEAMLAEEWDRLLRQQGSLEEVDAVGEGDLLYIKLVELDETGAIKPGGVYRDTVINQDMISDAELSAASLGKKVGDMLVFTDLPTALNRDRDSVISYMLGVKEQVEEVGNSFRAEITGIKRNTPAEPDQAFLDKVFGAGRVDSVDGAKEIIRRELNRAHNQRTERAFNDSLVEHILDQTEIPLPDDFLRRWLQSQKESGEATPGLDDYAFFRRNLKWSLIYNKVARDNNLQVSREDIEASVREDVRRHYGSAFDQLDEEDTKGLVQRLMEDKEYLEKVHSSMMDTRVFQFLHDAITIQDQIVSKEAFEQSQASNVAK